jgi:type VI protein secretion system component VasK
LSDPEKSKDSDIVASENIFRIADELVHQVNRTKKMVLIMVIALIVAIPVSWHVAALVKGIAFNIVGFIAIGIAVVFLAIGVRQWNALSKWTKKYNKYKELQKKVDETLDFEKVNSGDTP